MSQNSEPDINLAKKTIPDRVSGGCLERLFRPAVVVLVVLVIGGILFSIARDAVYKIQPYERGLHLRGGRFIGMDEPGWHFKIPFVDTVIAVMVIERSGFIENLPAMTADDVTMDISLLYTYRVEDPIRYQLEVLDPERIIAGYVRGTLRDIVNTREMDVVMHSRAEINQEVMASLMNKEDQYGVVFTHVQLQNASPPSEVVAAIKDRMVAVQLQEKAGAEATQLRTLADSEFYAAQKKAEGEAYQITKLAEAEATRINLTTQAEKEALSEILSELEGKGELAEQYIQVLIAQELQENSKWIISGANITPMVDLRDDNVETTQTEAP